MTSANGWRQRLRGALGGKVTEVPVAVTVALEEYRAVREEEMHAMRGSVSALRYGITGCAVLVGVAVQQHKDRYLGWGIALGLVPPVVLLAAVIWMGEYERMARASHYAAKLERRINQVLADVPWPPLRWANWLREGGIGRSRIAGGLHRYLVIVGVFVSLQLVAAGFGLHFYWHQHAHDDARRWVVPAAVFFDLSFLVALLIYFRSSYERLVTYADQMDESQPQARRRVRMRFRLYGLFVAVGFVSTPLISWALGLVVVALGAPWYAVVGPALLWMLIVPLVAHRGLMRELYRERIAHADAPANWQRALLERADVASHLTGEERDTLKVVNIDGLNAPAIGRHGITVTTMALGDPGTLRAIVAHELAHHRLGHLRASRLSYLYLWPYLYYDDVNRRFEERAVRSGKTMRIAFARSVRLALTLLALPGWLAWVLLRWGWRTAEYDADRYARFPHGNHDQLVRALKRQEQMQDAWRSEPTRQRLSTIWAALCARVKEERGLGYLPVPNEHPRARRRLKRLKRLER